MAESWSVTNRAYPNLVIIMKFLGVTFNALVDKIRFLPSERSGKYLYEVYKMYMVELNECVKTTELELEKLKRRRERVKQDFYTSYYNKNIIKSPVSQG